MDFYATQQAMVMAAMANGQHHQNPGAALDGIIDAATIQMRRYWEGKYAAVRAAWLSNQSQKVNKKRTAGEMAGGRAKHARVAQSAPGGLIPAQAAGPPGGLMGSPSEGALAPGGIVPAPGGLMSTSPVVSPTEDPRPDSVLPMVGGPEPAVALPAARTIPESASRATGAIAALAASSTSKAAAAAAAATSRHASETPVDSAVKVEADPRVGAAGEEGTQQGPIVKQEEAGSAPKGDAAASPREGSANAGLSALLSLTQSRSSARREEEDEEV